MTARAMGSAYTPAGNGQPAVVVLDVQHDDTDSFSRAVKPAAMRWGHAVGMRRHPGQWALTDADYCTHDAPALTRSQGGNGRPRAVSRFTFTIRPA
jgi:hypothetical protein